MDQTQDEGRRSIGARRNPETAEAILEAAEAILAERGAAGFSIEAVARRARAGKPTIYRWWPSRTALLLDVYQRRKPARDPDSGDLEEDVYRFLKHLFDPWRDTPSGAIFRSVLAEAQSDPEAGAALAAYAASRRAATGAIFARARERGDAAPDLDPEMAAEIVAGYAWSRLLTGRLDIDDAELRRAARLFTDGLRRRPSPG